MLYVVGIINVIEYQIIALTNLKTTGYMACLLEQQRGDVGRCTLFIPVDNLIDHHAFIPVETPYVAGLHLNDSTPRLLWLGYVASRS